MTRQLSMSAILVLSLGLGSCVPWTVRPIDADKDSSTGAATVNPAAYVDSIWTPKLVPAVLAAAVDARTLLDALSASPESARVRYGHQEPNGPVYFIVKGEGIVTSVDTRSRAGDGELQEGSNWEAAMAAAQFRLDNLTVIVDRNGLQQGDETERTVSLEPLAERWRAFGWAVKEVDGHDMDRLIGTFRSVPFESGRPSCVIAHTHKGRGVSFMEDRVEWHHRVPTSEELAEALTELDGAAI